MELRELFESKLILITEKANLPKYAIGKLAYSFANGNGEKNLNARIYSEPLLQREIAKKNEEIKSSGILGQLDHPVDGTTKLGKAMHILSNLSYEKTSKLANAESLILDTQSGRDFMTILKTGTKLGASMRGWGNVSEKGIVKDDWSLSSIDFVLNPSYGDIAQIDASNLIESFNPEVVEEDMKKTKIKIDHKNIELALKIQHDAMIQEYGDDRTFEQFKKENLMLTTAEWLSQNYENRFKDIREALDYIGSGELADGYIKRAEEEEAQRTVPYTVAEVSHEAYEAGANPKEFCDKLNADLKESQKMRAMGITEKERSLMSEMREAGVVGTPQELLEKVRKAQQMQKVFKPTLTEEQQKAEALKKLREQKKARRQRIIYEINRDIMNAGGAEPGVAKEMVRKALKAEGLDLDE